MKNEFNMIIKMQFRDMIEKIKFLLNHQFFIRDLFYAFIRQFNDDYYYYYWSYSIWRRL
jgi:hypothetical protein